MSQWGYLLTKIGFEGDVFRERDLEGFKILFEEANQQNDLTLIAAKELVNGTEGSM